MDGMLFNVTADGATAPRYEITVIGPDLALDLLRGQRPRALIRQDAVTAYAEAMRSGQWVLNGIPIVLAPNGILLDGVQRLRACAVAGVGFATLIARNVSADVLHTIDRQRRRSYAGALANRGLAHPRSVHAALAKLMGYDEEVLGRDAAGAGWGHLDRVLATNPDLADAVAASCAMRVPALHEAARSPLIYIGRRAAPAALRRLLSAIASPDDYAPDEPGVQLRRRLEEARGDRRGRLTVRETLALSLLALADTAKGKRRAFYRWNEGRDPFPRIPRYTGLVEPAPFRASLYRKPSRAENTPATPPHLVLSRETLTPDRARDYLRFNHGNRTISVTHVEGIVRDIRRGRWMMNAQPICFAQSGRLLNGQHRLSAVLQAGEPIDVLVLRGVPEEAWRTYDQQPRRPLEITTPEEFGDGALVSAAVTHLWRRHYRPDGTKAARPTGAEQAAILADHPDLPRLRTWARQVALFIRPSAALYLAAIISREGGAVGEDFLADLRDGSQLSPRDPVLRLRARLAGMRRSRASANEVIDAVLAIWKRHR